MQQDPHQCLQEVGAELAEVIGRVDDASQDVAGVGVDGDRQEGAGREHASPVRVQEAQETSGTLQTIERCLKNLVNSPGFNRVARRLLQLQTLSTRRNQSMNY